MFLHFDRMRQILFESTELHKGYSNVFLDIAKHIESTLDTLSKIKEEIK